MDALPLIVFDVNEDASRSHSAPRQSFLFAVLPHPGMLLRDNRRGFSFGGGATVLEVNRMVAV